jgi:integrase
MALLVTNLTFNTTAAGSELRHLRFEDVILDEGKPRMIVNADTAKNAYRARVIYLNDTAKGMIERCLERAKKLGAALPKHYVFPFRTRQVTGIQRNHNFIVA